LDCKNISWISESITCIVNLVLENVSCISDSSLVFQKRSIVF